MAEHENRVRVVCHLPINNDLQEIVLFEFLKLLQELRGIQGAEIGGFTLSRLESPVFFGYWWSKDKNQWARDNLVLCHLDYKADPTVRPVSQVIRQLKERIEELYKIH